MSRNEKSRMFRPLDNASLGRCFPWPTRPDSRPMCPDPGLYRGTRREAYCNENLIDVFPEKELRGLSPNFHIHVSVSDLYISKIPRFHIFSCSRIGRPVVGIYKSLTDIWMWKLGLRLHSSFSGNFYFKFLELCLCSALSHHPRDVFFKERNTQDFSFGDIAKIPESGLPFSRGSWSPSGGTARDSWGEVTPRPSPCPALWEACRSTSYWNPLKIVLVV